MRCCRSAPHGRKKTAGTDYATGKRVQKSVFGKTWAEVRDKLRTVIQENRGPAINFKGDYTVGKWMWLWFETYSKPNLRPSSVENYTNYIRWHIDPNIGRIKLKQLTPLQIQQFYNRTKEGGRVKRWEGMEDLSLSNQGGGGIHMILRQALQQAVNERIINHNPCDNCRIPK